MPRAFLITNRRYNSAVDYEENLPPSRESSPERRVSTAEGGPFFEEGDSCPSHHPSSPHSPAHESRSCQHSPITMSEPSPPPSFRAAALVTVIRQLMQQQQQPPASPGQPSASPPLQPDAHSCGECGKRYSTSSNLARHRQTHRSPTDARAARRCPHCGKVYVSAPAFAMHVRTHAQGCRCPYCGKCFSRPWLLQGHVRTHTGEKPFRCPVCSKAFADKSNLRAHVQTHSSSKPFVCARCGKAFALKSYLYKHEESSCMRVHHGKAEAAAAPLDLAAAPQRESGFLERDSGIRVG